MGASGYIQKAGLTQNAAASCPVGSTVSACLGSAAASRQLRRKGVASEDVQTLLRHSYGVRGLLETKKKITGWTNEACKVEVANRRVAQPRQEEGWFRMHSVIIF